MHHVVRAMEFVARALALLGGTVLLAIVSVVCLSIAGRTLGSIGSALADTSLAGLAPLFAWAGPVTGDYELVEAGTALAVFLFWPWCQISRAHAKVDLFTQALPGRGERWLALLWEVVFAAVIVLIAWRLYEGTLSKAQYGETTFMLRYPVWWAYAACLAAASLAALVGLWCVWLRVRDLFAPRSVVV